MKRTILTILGISIAANIAWLMFMMHDLNANYIKTQAIVTAIPGCGSSRSRGSLTNYCPTFTYYDTKGKSHELQMYGDGFNALNKPIFGVDMGDKKTIWYEKSNAESSFIAYGFGNSTVFVLPFAIGLIICAIIFVLKFVGGKKDKWPAGISGKNNPIK